MKSKPIGVRFDPELLAELKKDGKADSPQKALNFLADFWKQCKEPWKYFEHGRPFGGEPPIEPVKIVIKHDPERKLNLAEMVKKNEEKLMSKYDLERRMKKNGF